MDTSSFPVLIQQRQIYFLRPIAGAEQFGLSRFEQVLRPELVPLPFLSRRVDMLLSMRADAFVAAKRAEGGCGSL
jgi:hypothetical protein